MSSCSSCSSRSPHSTKNLGTKNLDTKRPFPYEANDLGIQIPILQVGSKSNTKSNVIYLSTSNPVFIKVKNIFKSSIIQNGGFLSIEENVLKLFNEHVFPSDETFSQVLEKIFEDYLTGLTWGFLNSQYKIYNTSEYPIVTILLYKANYQDILNIGNKDGQPDTATAANVLYCTDCCDLDSDCSAIASCSDCCNYTCGRNYNDCSGPSC